MALWGDIIQTCMHTCSSVRFHPIKYELTPPFIFPGITSIFSHKRRNSTLPIMRTEKTEHKFVFFGSSYFDIEEKRLITQGNSDFGAGHLNIDYNVKKAPECDGTISFSSSGLIF